MCIKFTTALRVAAVAVLPAFPVLAQPGTAPAGGQAPAPGAGQEARGAQASPFLSQMPVNTMRQLIGVDVIGADIRKIGDIKDLIIDRDGRVSAVVVGVGGVLGVGERSVAVPFEALLWNFSDVSPSAGPSASAKPGDIPPEANAVPPTAGARTDDPARRTSTVLVTGDGVPDHAVLRETTADLRNAPEFRPAGANRP